uniref:DUF1768 domain-containing protein n=1 Tax=Strongyloides papillosus TaxID=174720 RepID=A0A0N5B2V5_STREA
MQTCKSYTIVNGDYVIFKGKVSQLSNFFEKKFYDEDGTQFLTMEHFFQYKKAIFFNDTATAHRILKAPTALAVKRLARQIRNYNDDEWNMVREEITYKGLIMKFQDPELRAYLKKCYLCGNKPKYFIENSGHPFWGANIRNISSNIIYNQIRGQNKLGVLMNRLARQLFLSR